MQRLKDYLQNLADNQEIKTNGSKIEQKTRNAIRNEFTDLLTSVLNEAFSDLDIVVARTKEGVGIAVDNEKVGYIPIVLKPVFKDTAEDILELAEEYKEHLELKAEKEKAQAKAKASKIARQKEIAEQRRKLKELQNESETDDLE